MVSAESGSKEIGGISNSSSPRQGVWNVFYNKKINNVNINWYIINTWVNIKITPILFFIFHIIYRFIYRERVPNIELRILEFRIWNSYLRFV